MASYANWSVTEVVSWLRDAGLGQYQASFQRLRIDGRELVLLTKDELGKSGLGLSSEHQSLFLESRAALIAGRFVPLNTPSSPRSPGSSPMKPMAIRPDSLERSAVFAPGVPEFKPPRMDSRQQFNSTVPIQSSAEGLQMSQVGPGTFAASVFMNNPQARSASPAPQSSRPEGHQRIGSGSRVAPRVAAPTVTLAQSSIPPIPMQGTQARAGPAAVVVPIGADEAKIRREEEARRRLESQKKQHVQAIPVDTMSLLDDFLSEFSNGVPSTVVPATSHTRNDQKQEEERTKWAELEDEVLREAEEKLRQEEAQRKLGDPAEQRRLDAEARKRSEQLRLESELKARSFQQAAEKAEAEMKLRKQQEAKSREEDAIRRREEDARRQAEESRRREEEARLRQDEIRRRDDERRRLDDEDRRKEGSEAKSREEALRSEEERKRLMALKQRQDQEAAKLQSAQSAPSGLDSNSTAKPSLLLKRVMGSPEGGGLKSSVSLNALNANSPSLAATLLAKRDVRTPNDNIPTASPSNAPLLTRYELPQKEEKDYSIDDWKSRALNAEGNFNRLKEKVVNLVDRIKGQRETIDTQATRIAELERDLAFRREVELRIKGQIERIVKSNRENQVKAASNELESLETELKETKFGSAEVPQKKIDDEATAKERANALRLEQERSASAERERQERERVLEKDRLLEKERALERERTLAKEKEKALEREKLLALERERSLALEREKALAVEREQAAIMEKAIRDREAQQRAASELKAAQEKERLAALEKERVELLKLRERERAIENERIENEKIRQARERIEQERQERLRKERGEPEKSDGLDGWEEVEDLKRRLTGASDDVPKAPSAVAAIIGKIEAETAALSATRQSPRKHQVQHQVEEILDFLDDEEAKPLHKVGTGNPSSLGVPKPVEDPRRRSNTMITERSRARLETGELPKEDYVRRRSNSVPSAPGFQMRYVEVGKVAQTRAQLSALLSDVPSKTPGSYDSGTVKRGRLVRASSFSTIRGNKGSADTLSQLQEARNHMLQLQVQQESLPNRLSGLFTPPVNLPPLIYPIDVPAFLIEKELDSGADLDFRLNVITDLYQNKYMLGKHLNFICSSREKIQNFFVTALEAGDNFEILINSRRGFEEKIYKASDINLAKGSSVVKKLQNTIAERLQCNVYHVPGEALSHDIAMIEQKHQQRRTSFMFSLILCQQGQRDPLQMFKNPCTKEFSRFLKILGFNESEPDKPFRWNQQMDVIFHCAPFMNAEGHRRLIGNDRTILFFKEEGESFDPTDAGNLGAMPQSFIVVQPVGHQYRLGFFRRVSLKAFGPYLPKNHLFDSTSIADFLYTKVYNGVIMTMFCPPMNRLFETPRQSTIDDVVAKYPDLKKKKTGMKAFESNFTAVSQGISDGIKATRMAAKEKSKNWF